MPTSGPRPRESALLDPALVFQHLSGVPLRANICLGHRRAAHTHAMLALATAIPGHRGLLLRFPEGRAHAQKVGRLRVVKHSTLMR